MPSRADVDSLAEALATASGHAKASLRRILASVDLSDWAATRKALEPIWPDLIETYGDMAATVAGDLFEVWADEMQVRPQVVLVEGVNAQRANARLRWAIGSAASASNMETILDELVKQPGRSTIQKSAIKSGAAWARVPAGQETCSFCRMLAGCGAVYRSEQSASGRKYHGDCDCQPVLVRGPEDYPEGYNPEVLRATYDAAERDADGRGVKPILAAMRVIDGTN